MLFSLAIKGKTNLSFLWESAHYNYVMWDFVDVVSLWLQHTLELVDRVFWFLISSCFMILFLPCFSLSWHITLPRCLCCLSVSIPIFQLCLLSDLEILTQPSLFWSEEKKTLLWHSNLESWLCSWQCQSFSQAQPPPEAARVGWKKSSEMSLGTQLHLSFLSLDQWN